MDRFVKEDSRQKSISLTPHRVRTLFPSRQPGEHEPDEEQERDEEPNQSPKSWIQFRHALVEESWTARVLLCEEGVVLSRRVECRGCSVS
jgi:hypothetical protein